MGLGLTIAHRAISLNGGTIEMKDLPGVGCIIKITLPNASSKKTLETIDSSVPGKHSKRTNGSGAKTR
jgi:K+-sensing histidine kinase KdpD